MFKFKLSYVALAAALTSSFVYADPSSYTHKSGTKVIDIEAPNAAGVSHNLYRDFNVDSKGVVLNNSGSDYAHGTFGNIAKNNNLGNGSASVILNEVVSKNQSSLNGFIEVGGKKADVIIANPNGITCSGCSFINTPKAILTTGKVNLASTGAVGSYTVTNGTITIGKNGMDAANSYAVLLGDAINLNGMVTAQNAHLSAGNFTMDNATGVVTSAGKQATLLQKLNPAYSIDVSSLGGVKANNITMIGNNLGFGVRNKGAIVANSSLALTSNGSLINEGSINGNGFVTQIATAGELKNSGTIATKNIAMLTSYGDLNNTGTIENTSQMAVNAAGDLTNKGVIKSANTLVVNTNGNLSTGTGAYLQAGEQLQISALGNIDNAGYTEAKQTQVNFGGSEMTVSNTLSGTNTLLVQSVKEGKISNGVITNKGLISGGNVKLQTNGKIELAKKSTTSATQFLTAKSYALNNEGSMGGKTATVNIDNWSTTNGGHIIGKTINVLTWFDILNEGMIQSLGDLNINTQQNGNLINRSSIYSSGTFTLSAKKVVNGGYRCGFMNLSTCGVGNLNADKLVLNSTHKYSSEMGGTQYFKATQVNTVK